MERLALRRGSKLLAIATIAAAVSAIAPAHAIIGTPVMLGNSVPNGFTKSPDVVAVSYNSTINPLQSGVTVFDVNGDAVPGSVLVTGAQEKTMIFQASVAGRFTEELSPYTATFTARARNQAAATASAVHAFTFDVDFVTPFPPDVSIGDGSTPIVVSAGAESLVISGKAQDIVPESGNASGVKRVDVHFYNPATPKAPGQSAEIAEMRKPVVFSCTNDCNDLEQLSIDISNLPAGYWNIKVSVTDAAGNQSAQSAPIPVLKVATPA